MIFDTGVLPCWHIAQGTTRVCFSLVPSIGSLESNGCAKPGNLQLLKKIFSFYDEFTRRYSALFFTRNCLQSGPPGAIGKIYRVVLEIIRRRARAEIALSRGELLPADRAGGQADHPREIEIALWGNFFWGGREEKGY
ncbi:MAG: hypothetical protein RI601_01395 [Desulfurivibrionaceae bacterium]|nr:hypothetical protein [Desulfurivibrionaceae bacterium]